MTRQQQATGNRLIGLAMVSNPGLIKSPGQQDRQTRRLADRTARKLNADAERQIVAARRGTKLSARDVDGVLRARRMNEG